MKEKHGWNTFENYLRVHESVLKKYSSHIVSQNPKYVLVKFTDHYCQLTLEKLEIQTLKNTRIYINIQKDIEVQPGARRPIARTEGFSYQAWFKGNGGNIIRYCSPHDSHNQFHHKHNYTKIPPEVLKIEAGKWPHVSEFLGEIIMNY